MKKTSIQDLQESLKVFSQERHWAAFHSPKNLSMALAVEASELLEIFQWKTERESCELNSNEHQHACEEIADIFLYLLQISTKLNIDLLKEAEEKMKLNAIKHPIKSL